MLETIAKTAASVLRKSSCHGVKSIPIETGIELWKTIAPVMFPIARVSLLSLSQRTELNFSGSSVARGASTSAIRPAGSAHHRFDAGPIRLPPPHPVNPARRLPGGRDPSPPRRVRVANGGGAGMSAVAVLLAQSGHEVSGHDPAPSTPFPAMLADMGVAVTTVPGDAPLPPGAEAPGALSGSGRGEAMVIAVAERLRAAGASVVVGYGGGPGG